MDQATTEHLDFRVARVRVGLCEATQLPPLQWVMYCDPQGYWTRYDVSMEVEHPAFGQMFSQSLPQMGQGLGGNDGTKTRGHANTSEGSNNSTGAAPPTKKSNTGDSGKGKTLIQLRDEEYEIMESGDLVLIPQLNQKDDDVVDERVEQKVIPVPMCASPPSDTKSVANSTPPNSFSEGLIHDSGKDPDSLTPDTELMNLKSIPSLVDDTLMEISGTNTSSFMAEAEVVEAELSLIQAHLTQS
jgi:hypothetical protein